MFWLLHGGALALALATLCRAQTRSLSLLATPWDFHAGYQAAGQDGAALEEKLKVWLTTDELLPAEVVQKRLYILPAFACLSQIFCLRRAGRK